MSEAVQNDYRREVKHLEQWLLKPMDAWLQQHTLESTNPESLRPKGLNLTLGNFEHLILSL